MLERMFRNHVTSRIASVLAVTALVVACEETEQKPAVSPHPEPSASAMPVASVTPTAPASASAEPAKPPATFDLSDWKGEDRPKTWKDPRAVAALAKDCDFVPPKVKSGGMFIPADLLTCSLAWSQSCMPDPCSATTSACQQTCTGSCRDCGTTCSTSCKSCKDGCKDDACRSACAEKCADCKEECSRTLDRCSSGTCNKAAATCNENLQKAWTSGGCESKCSTFTKCVGSCKDDACRTACQKPLGSTLKTCRDKCKEGDALCSAKCLETSGCSPELCWSH